MHRQYPSINQTRIPKQEYSPPAGPRLALPTEPTPMLAGNIR